jgi:hypothetical protein
MEMEHNNNLPEQAKSQQISKPSNVTPWLNSFEQTYTEVKVTSLDDIVKSESPQLSVIRKHSGDDYVVQIIYLLVNDLVNFFNVGKTMDERQINETAELISEEFWMWKPEDFKLCFKNAKRGKYNGGKMYDRIDGQVIIDWCWQHHDERAAAFVKIREQEEKKQAEENKKPIDYNLVKQWYENGGDKYMIRDKGEEKEEAYRRYKAEQFKQQIENQQQNTEETK